MVDHHYDLIFKIIFVGDSGVGKTCLMEKYCNDNFNMHHDLTIGVEFCIKFTEFTLSNNKKIKIKSQFWDTAGQESFKSITKSYYRNVAAVILCYDTTNLQTFNHLTNWISDIKKECATDTILMLAGTKIDLENLRVIKTEQGEKFASDHNMAFYEVSAKKNINIENLFDTLILKIYNDYINGKIKNGIREYGMNQIIFNSRNNNTKDTNKSRFKFFCSI